MRQMQSSEAAVWGQQQMQGLGGGEPCSGYLAGVGEMLCACIKHRAAIKSRQAWLFSPEGEISGFPIGSPSELLLCPTVATAPSLFLPYFSLHQNDLSPSSPAAAWGVCSVMPAVDNLPAFTCGVGIGSLSAVGAVAQGRFL